MMAIASTDGTLSKFKLLAIIKALDNAIIFFVVLAFAGDDVLLC